MFPERLKSVRKSKKLTQDALAKLVGTKKATISNYETGYSTPSIYVLSDLAKALHVSTDYMLGLIDK